jgi:DNA-binding NarL/FixJ family response regulator
MAAWRFATQCAAETHTRCPISHSCGRGHIFVSDSHATRSTRSTNTRSCFRWKNRSLPACFWAKRTYGRGISNAVPRFWNRSVSKLTRATRTRASAPKSPYRGRCTYFQLRDYDSAEAALSRVLPSTDIIYANSLEYRGWIAAARTAYGNATTHFKEALRHLDRCRHADRFVEANCLHALASLAGERLDIGTSNFVRERAKRVDWSASGLATARFWVIFYSTYSLESLGRPLDAADAARAADALAPSGAYRVQARLRRASIARNAGDTAVSVYDHTRSALELYESISSHDLEGDERLVPLLLADHLSAIGDLATAKRLLAEYREHRSASTLLIATGDARVSAFERLVEAQIAEADRDESTASRAYHEAYQAFKRLTYSRRAAIAALRLAASGSRDVLYDEVDLLTKHLPNTSFLRKEVARRRAEDATRHLTPVEREVLRLLCAGLSPKEIAVRRARALKTIRNTIDVLKSTFGVRSMAALVALSIGQGYGTMIAEVSHDRASRARLDA